jgi:hypothetical protein
VRYEWKEAGKRERRKNRWKHVREDRKKLKKNGKMKRTR